MTSGIKGNGKNGKAEWASKTHNREFSKLFDQKKVDEVQEVDLKDKEAYDDLDKIVEKVRKARNKLRENLARRGSHENSGI